MTAVAPGASAVVATGAPAEGEEERRSPRWEGVRRAFLVKWPQCAVCAPGVTHPPGGLNVHHVVPVEFVRRAGRPELELDERNLITLCEAGENHHLVVGHLGDWRSYDPDVRADAVRVDCRGMTRAEIEGMGWWGARRAGRPKHWGEMTGAEMDALRGALAAGFPRG